MTQVIAKRYQILEERGAGGMGTVYGGLDTRTDNSVAIKLLNPQIASPSLIERFKREGEALRELNHPNIVKMLDAIKENGSHYLIMEYVDGGDLSHLLADNRLSIQQCLTMALDLADALTRAHKLNIIHRDLKPANILIAQDGTLRLTDFGVAHMSRMERVTDSNAMVGTIDYMSPETFEQKPVDERADVWSFGVILYEMLTNQRPFTGRTIIQIIHQISTEPVPDLEEFRPDAPIALVDLIYRMLAKDPQQRVPSVRIVGAELEAILKGYAIDTSSFSSVGDSSPKTVIPTNITRFQTPKPDSSEIRNNLPAQMTDFVGREDELAELQNHLLNPSTRMITVLAPGGMGKTRLALESARQNLANYSDGVFFVELAPLETVDDIVPAIADAVKFQFYAGGEPKEQLLDYLRNKDMLLIMDNYEHLLGGANLVAEILKAAEQISMLVTSRTKLNLGAEILFIISGMEFPEWETPEDALQYSAVKLFMQSARRVRPDFELEQDDLTYISRICRMVNGMPLGIELAASWLEMLSPEEVANELASSTDFLETDRSDLPERQRSLRAVFEYSWKLLNEREQDVLMKLSVFRTEFSRNGAQTVTGAGLRDLMALVNKSLLQRDPASGAYAIHKMLQQYAEEYLDESGEAEAIRNAHSDYFLVALAERESQLLGPDGLKFLDSIEDSIEDVRAAMTWACQQGYFGQINNALRSITLYFMYRSKSIIALPFYQQWVDNLYHLPQSNQRDNTLGYILLSKAFLHGNTGQNEQARDIFKEAELLIDDSETPIIRGFLELRRAWYQNWAQHQGGASKGEAGRPYIEQALAFYREADDLIGEIFALSQLSVSYWHGDWEQSEKYIQQAHKMLTRLGNQLMIMDTAAGCAAVSAQDGSGRTDESTAYALEAREYARVMGNKHGYAMISRNHGVGLFFVARYEEAIQFYQEALDIFLEIGHLQMAARSASNIGNAYDSMGQYDKADKAFKEALQYAEESKDLVWIGICNMRYASLLSIQGKYDEALKCLERQMEALTQWGDEVVLVGAYNNNASICGQMGDYESSIELSRQAIELAEKYNIDEQLYSAYLDNAIALINLGHYEQAEALLLPAIQYFRYEAKDPHTPVQALPLTLAISSWLKSLIGRADEAEAEIVEALERAARRPEWPKYGIVLACFAVWLDAAGHKEKAAELASFIVSEERFAHYSRRDTQPLLDALAKDYPEAIEHGKQADLKTVVEALLAKFGTE